MIATVKSTSQLSQLEEKEVILKKNNNKKKKKKHVDIATLRRGESLSEGGEREGRGGGRRRDIDTSVVGDVM